MELSHRPAAAQDICFGVLLRWCADGLFTVKEMNLLLALFTCVWSEDALASIRIRLDELRRGTVGQCELFVQNSGVACDKKQSVLFGEFRRSVEEAVRREQVRVERTAFLHAAFVAFLKSVPNTCQVFFANFSQRKESVNWKARLTETLALSCTSSDRVELFYLKQMLSGITVGRGLLSWKPWAILHDESELLYAALEERGGWSPERLARIEERWIRLNQTGRDASVGVLKSLVQMECERVEKPWLQKPIEQLRARGREFARVRLAQGKIASVTDTVVEALFVLFLTTTEDVDAPVAP